MNYDLVISWEIRLVSSCTPQVFQMMAELVLLFFSFIQGRLSGTAFCLNASKTYRFHPFTFNLRFVLRDDQTHTHSLIPLNRLHGSVTGSPSLSHLIILFLFNSCSNVGSTNWHQLDRVRHTVSKTFLIWTKQNDHLFLFCLKLCFPCYSF